MEYCGGLLHILPALLQFSANPWAMAVAKIKPMQLFRGECTAVLDWLMLGEIISPVSLHGRKRDPDVGDEMYKPAEFRAQN